MEIITEAIGAGVADLIKTGTGFLCVCLIVAVVFLWRALREERSINRDMFNSVLKVFGDSTKEMAEMRKDLVLSKPKGRGVTG